jgi:hypothetical protein
MPPPPGRQELQPKRGRLGVHAVGAAGDRRVAELLGAHEQRPLGALEPAEQELAGVAELQRECRVDDVGRRQAVVEPARRLAHLLGDRLGEREDVMVRAALDLLDAGDVDTGALAHGARRLGRDRPQLRPRFHGRDLDVEPPLEPALVRPDGAHRGAGIAGDHAVFVALPSSASGESQSTNRA